ncbi:hypothetical protein BJX64DRAFT_97734 [Aspergillus heterothallicus]
MFMYVRSEEVMAHASKVGVLLYALFTLEKSSLRGDQTNGPKDRRERKSRRIRPETALLLPRPLDSLYIAFSSLRFPSSLSLELGEVHRSGRKKKDSRRKFGVPYSSLACRLPVHCCPNSIVGEFGVELNRVGRLGSLKLKLGALKELTPQTSSASLTLGERKDKDEVCAKVLHGDQPIRTEAQSRILEIRIIIKYSCVELKRTLTDKFVGSCPPRIK